jgi:hypothetical protein
MPIISNEQPYLITKILLNVELTPPAGFKSSLHNSPERCLKFYVAPWVRGV